MATYTPPTLHPGKWGNVTSTLDWCEANYQFSYHIAEMANAFSNLFSIGLALLGMYHVHSQSLPTRYLFAYGGFALVGVGSFFFHSTLLIEAQLADELPMIYLVSYSMFLLLDTERGFKMSSRSIGILSAVMTSALGFTWSYCCLYRNPVYHQVVFGSLMVINIMRATYILKYSDDKERMSEGMRSFIIRNFITGALVFLSGFLVWNIDNIFCEPLTSLKRTIGWPVAFLFEGHSWWHCLTGLGTYLMFVGLHLVTLCVKDDQHKYAGDSFVGLPYIKNKVSSKKEL